MVRWHLTQGPSAIGAENDRTAAKVRTAESSPFLTFSRESAPDVRGTGQSENRHSARKRGLSTIFSLDHRLKRRFEDQSDAFVKPLIFSIALKKKDADHDLVQILASIRT